MEWLFPASAEGLSSSSSSAHFVKCRLSIPLKWDVRIKQVMQAIMQALNFTSNQSSFPINALAKAKMLGKAIRKPQHQTFSTLINLNHSKKNHEKDRRTQEIRVIDALRQKMALSGVRSMFHLPNHMKHIDLAWHSPRNKNVDP